MPIGSSHDDWYGNMCSTKDRNPRGKNYNDDSLQKKRVELLMEKGYSPECAEKILGVVYSKEVEYGR